MNAKYAVIKNNFVENLIVCAPEQVAEMEAALGATLMEATPLGMEIGDYYNGAAWTRNVDGVQAPLPIGDNRAVSEAIAILEGGITNVDE
ncbi:MAG: hypothetical protein KHX36_11550 [Clostridiales bacterium]|nr:hypothetical protein [Clostridiales bacterium]